MAVGHEGLVSGEALSPDDTPVSDETDAGVRWRGEGMKRLGDLLVEGGVITPEQLMVAVERQSVGGRRRKLGQVVVECGFASEEEIAAVLAHQLGIPYVDLASLPADPDLARLIPRKLAERYELVPVRRTDHGIVIAMADPTNVLAVDDVRVISGFQEVRLEIATASAVREAADSLYAMDSTAMDILDRLGAAAQVEVLPEYRVAEEDVEALQRSSRMAPIVRLVDALLADAVRGRATDVHIEPQSNDVKVRYRVDGLLREIMTLPKHVHASVVSRIKIVSGMDIAERRRPQDGSGRIRVDNRRIDMRVSTILTLTGEKVVIRLLRQEESLVDLATLGMEPEELAIVQQHLAMPQGLIVFTGPTGSGKTTTLYGSLMYLKSPEKNIVTIEDPIEYQMPGLSQVQIDEKTGMGFARWLRSVLRQDPNVIMVGEIRDLETAEIVMQSALTGHLVLSTLHTNDAPSAVIRLVDLGVEAFLVASAVTLVVAQRLVRVICDQCREAIEPAERVMSLLGLSAADLADVQFSRGKGCERCGYTGYRGRTGIYEIMPITAGIRAQISAGSSDTMLDASAHAAGMRRLRESGLRKVRAGVTTLEEVLRVTRVEREAVPRCPRCRQEIDPSFVVCPHCQVDLGGHACPKCGKEVQAGWAVCPFCRAVLPAAEQPSGRPRVLVVDDEPNLLSLVTVMLEEDFEVMTALTGEEGIRRATLERPDIVLLDLRLPDVSGVEVARRLQQSAVTSVIPVIMITGAADATSEIESLRAGVDDYVEKPFDEEVLRARMAKLLQKAARSRQDGAAG